MAKGSFNWLNYHNASQFESSAWLTPEFDFWRKSFRAGFARFLQDEFKATNIQMHFGHFEVYGFFTMPSGQIYYFNSGDVRWSTRQYGMLIRTAKSYMDFTGGHNNSIPTSSKAAFVEAMHAVLDRDA